MEVEMGMELALKPTAEDLELLVLATLVFSEVTN